MHHKTNDLAEDLAVPRFMDQRLAMCLSLFGLVACGSDTPSESSPSMEGPKHLAPGFTFMPPEPQRSGDPAAGRIALLTKPYVSCGLPKRVYELALGPSTPENRLSDRVGPNAQRNYFETQYTNEDGVEVVTTNCLICHAGRINGSLVIGLGNEFNDYTQDLGAVAEASIAFAENPEEEKAIRKWAERVSAISPWSTAHTRGVNPAESLTAALISHRDQTTLNWLGEPQLPLPDYGVVPLSVPPWWHMKKKNGLYYTGIGRGDHARFLMTIVTVCTDSIEEAEAVDAYFPDIAAYVESIEAPKYPFQIDEALAAEGQPIFERSCSGCHGTYGDVETYPNLLVDLNIVGTDPLLAQETFGSVDAYVDWYNASWFGELARAEPSRGYVAPPLDGVWATAPYFHNGSVPTLALVLDSPSRPTFWTRNFNQQEYDEVNVGWQFTVHDVGKDGQMSSEARVNLYDTQQPGYSNAGHLFGDGLTAMERRAVIEYLKTL
ncbi:MAG: hypothetical protein VX589_11865 [Myxococcota bacterium]|nr:hypothetical protein [Myxococcota bacterium]